MVCLAPGEFVRPMSAALLDLAVTDYLFNKFPTATSGQLSWMRSRAVCGPTLAWLCVHSLELHKYMLFNKTEMGRAIAAMVPRLTEMQLAEAIRDGWKMEVPKALADLVESLCGG